MERNQSPSLKNQLHDVGQLYLIINWIIPSPRTGFPCRRNPSAAIARMSGTSSPRSPALKSSPDPNGLPLSVATSSRPRRTVKIFEAEDSSSEEDVGPLKSTARVKDDPEVSQGPFMTHAVVVDMQHTQVTLTAQPRSQRNLPDPLWRHLPPSPCQWHPPRTSGQQVCPTRDYQVGCMVPHMPPLRLPPWNKARTTSSGATNTAITNELFRKSPLQRLVQHR